MNRFALGYNRTQGAIKILGQRAEAARVAAEQADESHFAASLRGKAKGYDEAVHILEALHKDRRLPKRSRERWTVGGVKPITESGES